MKITEFAVGYVLLLYNLLFLYDKNQVCFEIKKKTIDVIILCILLLCKCHIICNNYKYDYYFLLVYKII